MLDGQTLPGPTTMRPAMIDDAPGLGAAQPVLDLLDETPAAIAAKFTETQAREWLAAERAAGRKTSVSRCRDAWGWTRATAGRFLSRLKSETVPSAAAKPETGHPPPATRGPGGTLIADTMRTMKAAGASDEAIAIAVETVMRITERQAAEDELEEPEPFDPDVCWTVPAQHQALVQFCPSPDGTVRIEQDRGDQEQIITINAQGAVRAARALLYAAGFKTIGIYTYVKGGCEDLDDAATAADYFRKPPRP